MQKLEGNPRMFESVSSAQGFNFDRDSRPHTSMTAGFFAKRKYMPYKSKGDGFGLPQRNIQSQHSLLRPVASGKVADTATRSASHIMVKTVKAETRIKAKIERDRR